MAHYMINIPRRMIYETMLEFEDALLEIEILSQNEEAFQKHIENFVENSFPKLKQKFQEIKALLIMFFENEKFNTKEEFDSKLKFYLKDMENIDKRLQEDKNLPKEFKGTLPKIANRLEDKNTLVKDVEMTKESLKLLDKFNHIIPKILEIRRDRMK